MSSSADDDGEVRFQDTTSSDGGIDIGACSSSSDSSGSDSSSSSDSIFGNGRLCCVNNHGIVIVAPSSSGSSSSIILLDSNKLEKLPSYSSLSGHFSYHDCLTNINCKSSRIVEYAHARKKILLQTYPHTR